MNKGSSDALGLGRQSPLGSGKARCAVSVLPELPSQKPGLNPGLGPRWPFPSQNKLGLPSDRDEGKRASLS